MINSDFKK